MQRKNKSTFKRSHLAQVFKQNGLVIFSFKYCKRLYEWYIGIIFTRLEASRGIGAQVCDRKRDCLWV